MQLHRIAFGNIHDDPDPGDVHQRDHRPARLDPLSDLGVLGSHKPVKWRDDRFLFDAIGQGLDLGFGHQQRLGHGSVGIEGVIVGTLGNAVVLPQAPHPFQLLLRIFQVGLDPLPLGHTSFEFQGLLPCF